ncbi:hypothetical protein OIU77_016884 [Salix suchowensis]|uniref:DUS-like FMN-binding domain-containing protein n=1 Tax=Salix suchowensis TaxID=1278906 RepID=A0ABQ8ZLW5_9ROSI|nr:hypothetical protein OIU77_016884 [Salix suchowensis]
MGAEQYRPPLFSVAPMMDWTDNHYRTVARIISKHAWLYTEMLAAETIVHQQGDLDRFLAFSPEQHPIVLQIGGNNLDSIAKATQLANSYGYDEINLNCGCPSPKVAGHGCFGVRLMLDPKFVGEVMSVIAANTDVPVSVKCRIGLDDHDSYNELCDFIYKLTIEGFLPLKYEYYYALLRDFPDLRFTINGGINCVDEVNAALREGAHGVMVGRAAYNYLWNTLAHVDSAIYGAPSSGLTRRQVLEQYQIYGDAVLGTFGNSRPNIRDLIKPLFGFFHSEPGNNLWKRKADAAFQMKNITTVKSFFEETLVAIPDAVLDSHVAELPSGRKDLFANVRGLLPPPYETREEESQATATRRLVVASAARGNEVEKQQQQQLVSAQLPFPSACDLYLRIIMIRINSPPSILNRNLPVILYAPTSDPAPCEITINFAQKHEVRQVYVRSTARVYEIYCAPEQQSSTEYLCTVRCGIAARDEEVLLATNVEAVLAHARSSIQEPAEEKLRNGSSLSPNEDDWVEVKALDSPLAINRNSSSSNSDIKPERNSQNLQVFYEATAEITDANPSTSLTLRLLSLQNKGYVCVDEVYVFGDPADAK